MHRFDWLEPRSLDEVHAALREHGDDARLMAGGTALMLLMRQGLVQPAVIVSLQRVPGLDTVEAQNGTLRIGALCTHRRVETHALVRERHPALHETLERVATIRIRNMGTIGGNLAHSDPSQDPPPTLLALGASVEVAGPDGARSIPLDEFFTDYYENALEPGEVLTAIEVPDQAASFSGNGAAGGRYVQAFSKFLPRSVDDYATVAVAVSMAVSADGQRCEDVRIGLGSAGPTPLRARGAEAALRGRELTDAALREAGEAAAAECDPLADVRGSSAYKREMVKVWLARTVRKAISR
jgi:carbon-monoxide dehydrogenase medium subunit